MIKAWELATESQKAVLDQLRKEDSNNKVEKTLDIFKSCGVDLWAKELMETFLKKALEHLDDIAVLSVRKKPLEQLAAFLIKRDY